MGMVIAYIGITIFLVVCKYKDHINGAYILIYPVSKILIPFAGLAVCMYKPRPGYLQKSLSFFFKGVLGFINLVLVFGIVFELFPPYQMPQN